MFSLAGVSDVSITFSFSMVEAFRCLNLIYILFGKGFRSLSGRGFRAVNNIYILFGRGLDLSMAGVLELSIIFTFSLAGGLDISMSGVLKVSTIFTFSLAGVLDFSIMQPKELKTKTSTKQHLLKLKKKQNCYYIS